MSRVEVISHEKEVTDAIRKAIAYALAETAAALEAEAKLQAQHLIYDTPESPTYKRTGNLIGSIRSKSDDKSAEVSANTPYAFFVHEGTRYMSPRPFLNNALEKEGPKLVDRMKRSMT